MLQGYSTSFKYVIKASSRLIIIFKKSPPPFQKKTHNKVQPTNKNESKEKKYNKIKFLTQIRNLNTNKPIHITTRLPQPFIHSSFAITRSLTHKRRSLITSTYRQRLSLLQRLLYSFPVATFHFSTDDPRTKENISVQILPLAIPDRRHQGFL